MSEELSSFSLVRLSLRDGRDLILRVFRKYWPILVFIHVARGMTNELFTYSAQVIQARGREDMLAIALTALLQFLFEILWSATWSFFTICAVRATVRSEPLFRQSWWIDLNQLAIEGVRVLAAILFRIPLLILPAMIEIIRLSFVSHIVLLDENYPLGRVDALKRSRELISGRKFLIVAAWMIYFGVSAGITLMLHRTAQSMSSWFWERPLLFLTDSALTLAINLCFDVFLIALFLRLSMMLAFKPKSPNE